MIPRIVLWVGLAVLFLSASPASSTTLYTWRNSDGSIVFTDDPRGAPSEVQIRVWPDVDAPPSSPEPAVPVSAAMPPTSVTIRGGTTQGGFAARLVTELGLRERSDADEAADLLSRYRIAPRLGRWELDQPLDPELTVRLRRLTAASASEGWIDVTPEEALLAFDTTAALLGVPIPEPTGGEFDAYAPSAIADTPPLVYSDAPPPELYPYYVWQPWTDGYWVNGVIVSGVYILDVDRYAGRHPRHHDHKPRGKFHRRHGKDDHENIMTPDRIGHHVRHRGTRDTATVTSGPPGHPQQASSIAAPMQRPPARLIDPGSRPRQHLGERRPISRQIKNRHQASATSRPGHPGVRSVGSNVSSSERSTGAAGAGGRRELPPN